MTPATGDLRLTVLQPSKNHIEGILLHTHGGQYYHAVASRESVMSFDAPESRKWQKKTRVKNSRVPYQYLYTPTIILSNEQLDVTSYLHLITLKELVALSAEWSWLLPFTTHHMPLKASSLLGKHFMDTRKALFKLIHLREKWGKDAYRFL